MSTVDTSLKNHFLIAMPNMEDPNFSHSLTYLCEHSSEGAMGIVINRPMKLTLGEVFAHLKIQNYDTDFDHQPVMSGGPVQIERGFVLHQSDRPWNATNKIQDDIYLATSLDILQAIAHNEGPEQHLVALGYAGWGPGQLDEEMSNNAWLSVPADPAIIFATPQEKRWQAAASLLGIDLTLLSADAGHA
ncbi:MAG: YqgE/AlgH family protein [Gammaproteobacteria bacterium]|nr:MAG: YqgE/AlgH family protein [Gammaproteobacteria bacterium]